MKYITLAKLYELRLAVGEPIGICKAICEGRVKVISHPDGTEGVHRQRRRLLANHLAATY